MASEVTKVSRAKNIFDKAVRDYGISDTGARWLMSAIDPYHDEDMNPAGFPDTNVSGSLMQVVKRSMTLKAPDGVTGNWDCNVYNLPHVLENTYTSSGTATPATYFPLSANLAVKNASSLPYLVDAGGVVAIYGDPQATQFQAGYGMNLTAMVGNSPALPDFDKVAYNSLPLDGDSYFGGNSRVVAMGFEVVNTTAEINLQGLVTAYRQPLAHDASLAGTVTESTRSRTATIRLLYDAPGKQDDMMLLTGTRQWKAKDGGYCTCTLNSTDNPSGPMQSVVLFLSSTEYDETDTASGAAGCQSNGTAITLRPIDPPRFNTSGLYFAGLSKETTLTVNVIYYVERFPSVKNQQLVVLASPSPGYDSVALEMYSRALCHMPPGVPQWENGLGDWFKDVVASIPKVACTVAPILGMLPVPGANTMQGVAKAIGKIGAPGKTYSPGAGTSSNAQRKPDYKKIDAIVQQIAGRSLSAKQIAALHSALNT